MSFPSVGTIKLIISPPDTPIPSESPNRVPSSQDLRFLTVPTIIKMHDSNRRAERVINHDKEVKYVMIAAVVATALLFLSIHMMGGNPTK